MDMEKMKKDLRRWSSISNLEKKMLHLQNILQVNVI